MRVETIGRATLYLGDCRDVLPGLDGIDHIISDPPYEDELHNAVTHYELRTGRNVPIMRFEDEARARAEMALRSPRYNGSIRLVRVLTSVVEEELAA